uniref:Uncharacterized protein n=1 Tax=Anguilla anguilla TaxID=7936 RepID=A0A0E9WA98_ANGAN
MRSNSSRDYRNNPASNSIQAIWTSLGTSTCITG